MWNNISVEAINLRTKGLEKTEKFRSKLRILSWKFVKEWNERLTGGFCFNGVVVGYKLFEPISAWNFLLN